MNDKKKLAREIQQTPPEYLFALLQIVRSYCESVTLKTAEESFREGWKQVTCGESFLIADLWKDIDRV